VPFPALPAAPASLALGAHPQTLGRAVARQGGDVIIGGAGFGKRADLRHASPYPFVPSVVEGRVL
jgi:hypothetical protein